MTGELAVTQNTALRLPPVPWRDPHTVSPAQLAEYIAGLERACAENPRCADLRTCLGMAHAMNYDVYRSMDALEYAVEVDPQHFFAQLKYSELFYRLRALVRAEQETIKAMDLAGNAWELSLARKQLQEIRRLSREGTQKPEWTKSLKSPAVVLVAMAIILCLVVNWK
uniref:Tetratricopeptide TPR_2 repeat protein n=1 Tax=Solibacter usitatus (strain Ellin6076) TaxID=234267 RepID=Q01V37_SOLUE